MRVTMIGRTDRPERCAWRWSDRPLRNNGRPKMPNTAVPIRIVPPMSHRSARRWASRLSSAWSSRPMVPPPAPAPASCVVVMVSPLPVPLRPEVQLDGEHQGQVAVDHDLEDHESPSLLTVLFVHVMTPSFPCS